MQQSFEVTGPVRLDVHLASGLIEIEPSLDGHVEVELIAHDSESQQLVDNMVTLLDAINRARPTGAKGQYLRTLTITPTMGPGIRIDIPAVLAIAAAS